MEERKRFKGVIPPVSSLLLDDDSLDKDGMKKHIDFLIDSKVDGLFFLGSGGEFANMTESFRKEIAEFVISYVNKRVPVLIGTGTPSTKETISLSQHAKKAGADGVIIINPYYYKLNDTALFSHYATIAEKVDLPIILYNFPGCTGQDLTPTFLLKLAKTYPNIVGLKDTTQEIAHTREVIQIVKSEVPYFSVFCGYDDHFLNTLLNGGDGSIGLTANFAPEVQVGLYQAYQQNDFISAANYHQILAQLVSLYTLDSPFYNLAKDGLRFRGFDISTKVLPPATELSDDKKAYVKDFLQKVLPNYFK
ncbi:MULTISPECIES: dihydrodipicolinate synthase family protein [Bacillaceae]|uniref:Putative 2-keto-3-deoxy-galactonate aldolase YagE n=1 Tax=Caldibacillus thermoamylovorans TaxID=35841 RepID=A0A090ITA5_9BACI|nr:dihydrodipicolinate synthase family protein [Caldibacillus thermoamylovorans]CEE00902.1 putative 2-keto-3-deoxy-galactonate aldolase YagE [Caldibacillus thermoamylovorans]